MPDVTGRTQSLSPARRAVGDLLERIQNTDLLAEVKGLQVGMLKAG